MEANILPSGEIPVYFSKGIDTPGDAGNWATHCISVEVNLLLGLVDYDWDRYRALIAASAMNVFDRILKQGWGLTTNYDVLLRQRDLADARSSELRALIDYNLALAALDRALGATLEKKNIKLTDIWGAMD